MHQKKKNIKKYLGIQIYQVEYLPSIGKAMFMFPIQKKSNIKRYASNI